MLPWDLGQLIQFIGYPGLFAIIFAESGLIIGFFLPGASLLFTSGFLASQEFLDIRIIVPLVAIAAILGDNVGYWFGAKVGIHLFDKPNSRFFKRKYLERTKRFYAKYGTRTIVLARFVPVVRTFAPILAGVANMDYRVFMFYNALGGVLWASGISFLGYMLGQTFPKTADYIEVVVLAIIVVTCIPLAREFWKHRYDRLKNPRAVLFDLDNTLTKDFKPPHLHTASRLHRLLNMVPVAIMSGASFKQMQEYLLPTLPADIDKTKLYLFPDTAGQCYLWEENMWKQQYNFDFTQEEKTKIVSAVTKSLEEQGISPDAGKYGEKIKIKQAQITITGLGFDAPAEEKNAWDPDSSKRKQIKRDLEKRLPDQEILVAGRTSLDITRKGIDKAYGVRWLAKRLEVEPKDMLFVGDEIYPGGNDYVVMESGVETLQVQNPEETALLMEKILESLEKAKK